MHIRRSFLGWGVFLILAGAVPLAVRGGYLTTDQIGRLWTLWPLILVGVGVGLILTRTRFDFIGGIIVAATLGLMAGGLISTGVGAVSTGACGEGGRTAAFPARDGAFATTGGSVQIDADCADVTLGVGSDDAWRVEGEDDDGLGPVIEATETTLDVRPRDESGRPFWTLGERDTWRVTVPTTTTVDVAVQLNAGQATIDLGSAEAVEGMDIGLNAGSLGLTLPRVSTTGTIHANAGAVRLCAPEGVGLKLQTNESIVASYDYADQGLVQDGSTWTTPGFDTASVKIQLETEANAGSFALDPEDGCD
jgi:hypothetical protein